MGMIGRVCAEIKNYFVNEDDKKFGTFRIENGSIVPSINYPTDYIRIVGSNRNDGVHKLSDFDLVDEGDFKGSIWLMHPDRDFLRLVEEIAKWEEKNGGYDAPSNSPYTSESFGGYSYSISGVGEVSWETVYKKRLNVYRKIRV